MTLTALRRKLEHHHRLDDAVWRELADCFGPGRAYSAGQEIMEQFSAPKNSTLILSGVAGRIVTGRDGRHQITAIHIAGDFVDLHSFLLNRLDHSVVALSDCVATNAPHHALQAVTDAHPGLTRALWFLTVVDAALHRQWLAVVGAHDALARAAHLLCELYLRMRDVGLSADHRFRLELTQADIADALCITTVHCNRTIQELRRRGLVEWSRQIVQILDWDGLVSLGQFNPTYLQLGAPE